MSSRVIAGLTAERTPVFVVGMMRSGSTLVEQIIAAHPRGHGAGEDSVFNGLLPNIRDDIVAAVGQNDLAVLSRTVQGWSRKVIANMRKKLPSDADKDPRIVDKMLFNYRNIGFIHMLFPDAPIIHVRLPCDEASDGQHGTPAAIVRSSARRWIAYGAAITTSSTTAGSNGRSRLKTSHRCMGREHIVCVQRDVTPFARAAQYYAVYRALMVHWHKVLPGRILDVRYEDLIAHQDVVSRRIIKHIGLPWDKSVLEFWKKRRAVHTHSMQQVHRPLYTGSIGASNAYREQLKPLREMLGELADEVRPDSPARARHPLTTPRLSLDRSRIPSCASRLPTSRPLLSQRN